MDGFYFSNKSCITQPSQFICAKPAQIKLRPNQVSQANLSTISLSFAKPSPLGSAPRLITILRNIWDKLRGVDNLPYLTYPSPNSSFNTLHNLFLLRFRFQSATIHVANKIFLQIQSSLYYILESKPKDKATNH